MLSTDERREKIKLHFEEGEVEDGEEIEVESK